MASILCLETATTNCSVALSIDGKVVALREENSQKFSHSEKLHVFIEEVLAEANFDKTNLNAVAVSKGPGSYTGLRIGVSAAKGLCFALDIPLIAIPTLEVLARQMDLEGEGNIVPMIDARRMEVYSAVFNSKMVPLRETRAEILNENSFMEYVSKWQTVFLGDGATKFKPLCNHPNALFLDNKFPSAAEMASLVEMKFTNAEIENVAYFEPYYLKEFKSG